MSRDLRQCDVFLLVPSCNLSNTETGSWLSTQTFFFWWSPTLVQTIHLSVAQLFSCQVFQHVSQLLLVFSSLMELPVGFLFLSFILPLLQFSYSHFCFGQMPKSTHLLCQPCFALSTASFSLTLVACGFITPATAVWYRPSSTSK